ncbi:DUF418 domain-containing protein [Virgibacillus siamensis]|uniref:DUF418 domain-containing protein n=1 Tax=Virgibacillus siamensis TaxID=480071 RepID=UPI000985A91C|nr:DUF418 domain-containing protein [Virgibacillus siamensis]
MNSITPTKGSERLTWIDAARGFAIFGIFIVNIGAFSAPYFLYGGAEEAWSAPVDQFTQAFKDVFFQASFYTLFSILFGFGFQIMMERVIDKGINAKLFLFRRLLILICFGIVHAFLIWSGDILLSYGIIGLFLIAFIHRKDKTLLAYAIVLLGFSVSYFSHYLFQVREFLGYSNFVGINQARENYLSNDLSVIISQNIHDWIYSNGLFTYLLFVTTLLPMFLLGMYIARRRWLHEPAANKRVIWSWWSVSLLFFISLKWGPYLYGNPEWFYFIQDNVGGTASALFYLFSITLLYQSRIGAKLFQPFSYVGRMSLTNYIFQSVISFVLFYGVGFGLYGSITPSVSIGIVIIVFSLQVVLSKFWMVKYRFGPLEWVWRSLTYQKIQPMRRVQIRGSEVEKG